MQAHPLPGRRGLGRDWSLHKNDVNNLDGSDTCESDHSTCLRLYACLREPFEIEWGIFPAEMRADAEAAAAGGILFRFRINHHYGEP